MDVMGCVDLFDLCGRWTARLYAHHMLFVAHAHHILAAAIPALCESYTNRDQRFDFFFFNGSLRSWWSAAMIAFAGFAPFRFFLVLTRAGLPLRFTCVVLSSRPRFFRFLFPRPQSMSLDTSETGDDLSNLPASTAPRAGARGGLLKKMPSQSVKNLLDTVTMPDTT